MTNTTALSKSQRGFSLVELMIAVGLSAALMFGVIQIFDANKQSSRLQRAMVEVQESGRIATELLSRSIRMADYWGCMELVDEIYSTIDSSDDLVNPADQTAVNGTFNNAVGTTFDSNYTLATGSDTLFLNSSSYSNGLRIAKGLPHTAAIFKIENNPSVNVPQGSILLITDCSTADLFVTTDNGGEQGDNSGGSLNLHHNGGNNRPYYENKNGQSGKVKGTYGDDSQFFFPVSRTYFVGRNASASVDSLYVQENGVTSELVRNVSNLQITYGLDSDKDGVVDTYDEAPDSDAKFDTALSIRAVVTVHSSDTVASNDVLSRDFTITANIRNRAG